ncbi:hypothetical protein J4403_02585 [Candidatus Woesearchaeota archaeon]|nr:hypothetical protein [Candidatus Woesearchaeota archaeon]
MEVFKLEYNWYEGEHEATLLGKKVEREEFEKDLIKSKEFAEKLVGKKIKEGEYLGKGYRVECLPEYYGQVIWFFTQKLDYVELYFDEDISYDLDNFSNKKLLVTRVEKKIDRIDLTMNIVI